MNHFTVLTTNNLVQSSAVFNFRTHYLFRLKHALIEHALSTCFLLLASLWYRDVTSTILNNGNVTGLDKHTVYIIANNSLILSSILIKFLLICSQWIILRFWRQSIWTSTWRCFKHALLIKKPFAHCVVWRVSMTSSLWRHGQAAQLSDPRAFNKGLHDKNSRILRPISIKLFSIYSEWIALH